MVIPSASHIFWRLAIVGLVSFLSRLLRNPSESLVFSETSANVSPRCFLRFFIQVPKGVGMLENPFIDFAFKMIAQKASSESDNGFAESKEEDRSAWAPRPPLSGNRQQRQSGKSERDGSRRGGLEHEGRPALRDLGSRWYPIAAPAY